MQRVLAAQRLELARQGSQTRRMAHGLRQLRLGDPRRRQVLPGLRCRPDRGRRRRRSARSSRSCSSTSSAPPRTPTAPTPRTSASATSSTTRRRASGSSATAASSRSTSATRSWRCSARRSRGATTPSERCGRRSASSRASRELNERHAGLDLEVRAAVGSGEAMVALNAAPGDALATGDVVNTAARLESAAPPGRAIVGEETYRLTRHAFSFEELDRDRGEGQARDRRRVARRRAARGAGQPSDLEDAARRARPRAADDPHGLGPRREREPAAPRHGAGARRDRQVAAGAGGRRRRSRARAGACCGAGACRTRSRRRTAAWARSSASPPASSRTTPVDVARAKLARRGRGALPAGGVRRRHAIPVAAARARPRRAGERGDPPPVRHAALRRAPVGARARSCWSSRTCTGPTTCCST